LGRVFLRHKPFPDRVDPPVIEWPEFGGVFAQHGVKANRSAGCGTCPSIDAAA